MLDNTAIAKSSNGNKTWSVRELSGMTRGSTDHIYYGISNDDRYDSESSDHTDKAIYVFNLTVTEDALSFNQKNNTIDGIFLGEPAGGDEPSISDTESLIYLQDSVNNNSYFIMSTEGENGNDLMAVMREI